MSNLKVIFLILIICFALSTDAQPEEFEVPCYQHFREGECDGLTPKASGCTWIRGNKHGLCAYKDDEGKWNHKFRTPKSDL